MTVEFAEGGYARLEAAIREIEELAWDGAFAGPSAAASFHKIAGKAKALRQVLQEAAVFNPFGDGGGEAA
jgi:hypothetical protein